MYIRCILDEIFGFDCMKNEITWHYEKWTAPSGDSFQKNHDTIFMYSKGNNKFNTIKEVTDNLKSKYENGYLIGGGYGSGEVLRPGGSQTPDDASGQNDKGQAGAVTDTPLPESGNG